MNYSTWKWKLALAVCIAVLLLPACRNKRVMAKKIEQQSEIPKDEEEFQNKAAIVLEAYITSLHAVDVDSIHQANWQALVQQAYKDSKYKTRWINKDGINAKGKEMLQFLGSAEFLGLNKELYGYETLHQLADSLQHLQPNVDFNLSKLVEVGLTRSFLQVALHVDHGMFTDTIKGISSNFWSSKKKYLELLEKTDKDSVSHIIATLEPNNPAYNRYMAALRAFVSKNNISSVPLHVRDPKTDSVGAVKDARQALVYHHYLIDSLKDNDSAYKSSLKKFQRANNLNGDGAIGANTIRALERDNSKKFQLLAINADRWRKENLIKLPARYVWVNLPSYHLKIIEHDTLRLEKRVVIGKATDRAETPILESAINQIVLWPTWTVPQSIIKKEMKSFKGYVVTKGNGWIQVVQPPGMKNSLGTVKILFPNKYSVYIHDTPAKSLFNSDFRAASHGCVRCQDALEVAATLMMMDSIDISYDSLKALRDEKIATRSFRIKKSIPVYFRYFTAEADFDGNVNFYADVYKRDKDMIDFIFNGKQPHVATREEKALAARIKAVADSVTRLKKKISDSLYAQAKVQEKQKEKIVEIKKTVPQSDDTASAKQDSL
jgi:murein L,D-transpeptidase YcbB/YkuD